MARRFSDGGAIGLAEVRSRKRKSKIVPPPLKGWATHALLFTSLVRRSTP